MRLCIIGFNGRINVTNGTVFLDPGDGALYCCAGGVREQAEKNGYRFVHTPFRVYVTVRELIENEKYEEAETAFWAAKIKGEIQ